MIFRKSPEGPRHRSPRTLGFIWTFTFIGWSFIGRTCSNLEYYQSLELYWYQVVFYNILIGIIALKLLPIKLRPVKVNKFISRLFLVWWLYFNVEIRVHDSLQALLVVCFNIEIKVRNSLQALLAVCVNAEIRIRNNLQALLVVYFNVEINVLND